MTNGFSLVTMSRGHSSCSARASHCSGFSLWFPGSRAEAQQLWYTGLVAPRHVGSSQSTDQTLVPRTGRQILNWTTRETLTALLLIFQVLIQIFSFQRALPDHPS